MVLLFLGISGSGKDTQAELLGREQGFKVISTGGIIRKEINSGSEVGKMIHDVVSKGDWVEDEIVYQLLQQELSRSDTEKVILTGAVRAFHQVEMLDSVLAKLGAKLDGVVLFDLSEEEAVRRISGRRYGRDGNLYHVEFNPPPAGLEVEQREDDSPEATQERILEYKRTVTPIEEEYAKRGLLLRVDASKSISEIHSDLVSRLFSSEADYKLQIKQDLAAAISKVGDLEVGVDEVELTSISDGELGDLASNIALKFAGKLGKSPREVAVEIVGKLPKRDFTLEVTVAGPGFINFSLNSIVYKRLINVVDSRYGQHNLGAGKKVMVEYGQPNTHKAFHVGHLKSAISGLAVVGLMENLGYEVVEANFYGDVGMHVAKCTWGFLQKYSLEQIAPMGVHERMKIIDQAYVYGSKMFSEDKQAEIEIREVNKEIYNKSAGVVFITYAKLRDWSLEHFDEVFGRLGVHYDRQYPESELSGEAVEIVRKNIGGIFSESEGAVIFPGEDKGFVNWVFITSEGNPTYEAKDLALAYKKFQEYELDQSIITTSVEQRDRFLAIIWILEQINPDLKGRYKHIPFGWLLRNNRKTSSRMGESIKGIEVIEEAIDNARNSISSVKDYSEKEIEEISTKVGLAGLKFLITSHEFHKDINYDPEQFTSFDGFSGPYILYTYVRTRALLEGSEEEVPAKMDLENVFNHPAEIEVLKKLEEFPEITLIAGNKVAPHLLANYLFGLANSYNKFYEKCPVLKAEVEQDRIARLKLTQACGQVLKKGLGVLGIDTLEKM